MNNITELVKGLKDVGVGGWDAIKSIGKFLNFLMHPSLIIKALWDYTLIYSFWICLFVAMLAAIFYALGFKKCAKYIPGSIAVYTLIKMLGSAI
ncbi:hypothetical protein [Clostridium sp. FP1]|uniref:hypothetical protein n=1 Tax=Clostridium sp. FP1 TaxID=2724076 RepID=UPI0013E94D7F|nr:hypothetical protein [Clostridium sp. FP1]MBZ9633104.1 hypothetical protein [Clostridium sp. FP1]